MGVRFRRRGMRMRRGEAHMFADLARRTKGEGTGEGSRRRRRRRRDAMVVPMCDAGSSLVCAGSHWQNPGESWPREGQRACRMQAVRTGAAAAPSAPFMCVYAGAQRWAGRAASSVLHEGVVRTCTKSSTARGPRRTLQTRTSHRHTRLTQGLAPSFVASMAL